MLRRQFVIDRKHFVTQAAKCIDFLTVRQLAADSLCSPPQLFDLPHRVMDGAQLAFELVDEVDLVVNKDLGLIFKRAILLRTVEIHKPLYERVEGALNVNRIRRRWAVSPSAPSFTHQCTAGGQTTATWTGAQLVRVTIGWYDALSTFTQVSFDVKKKPSGSISVSTPTTAVSAEASFYDSAGVEVAGLVDRDYSDGAPTP